MKTIMLCFAIVLTSSITVAQKPPERCAETPCKPSSVDELKKINRELDAAAERGD